MSIIYLFSKPAEIDMKSRILSCIASSVILLSMSPLWAADNPDADAEPPQCEYCPEISGWYGWIEGGIGNQSEDDYRFGRYTGDIDKGTRIGVNAEINFAGENGEFVESEIRGLGGDAPYLQVQGGRQGQYELGLELDTIPNNREGEVYSPYREAGNGALELPSGWVSGATTQTMPELSDALKRTPLQTERERSRINARYHLNANWQVSTYISHEEKKGIRDVGASFGAGQTVILPLPIDYITDEIGLTLDYHDDNFQSQFNFVSSQFDNDLNRISWQNPFENNVSNTFTGQMTADSPDNEFQQISAILGYRISPLTRISARFASGSMTQNEAFLPYTINPAIATSNPAVSSLDGRVDTRLASLQVNSRPLPQLRLNASYTNSDRNNKTDINSYDTVSVDTAAGGTRNNRPYSYEQQLLRLKASYRFPQSMNLSAGYDDDEMDRDYTSIEQTREKTLWARFKFRVGENLDSALKLSTADRKASGYQPLSDIDPLFDFPDTNYYNNELMRMYNMADRKRDTLGVDLAYSVDPSMTLGLDISYSNDDYDKMELGLQKATNLAYTASMSWSMSETLTSTLFYSRDVLESDQRGSARLLATAADDFWVASDRNRSDSFGLGVDWAAIEDTLTIGAELNYTDFNGELKYANSSDLPQLQSTLTSINVHGNYTLSEEMALKFELRREDYQETNWSRNGSVNQIPNLLTLGEAERDITTTLVFVTLYYQF